MQKWLLFGKTEIEYEKAQLLCSGLVKISFSAGVSPAGAVTTAIMGGMGACAPGMRDSTGGARLARPVESGIVNPTPFLAPAFEDLT